MMARLLEAVPNFSEGRDLAVVEAIVEAMRGAGADVLDWSADPDHHRAVVTVVGAPHVVEDAAVAAARVAVERIDLRRHDGIHPRIGALDVLPFVPLVGLTPADAVASARRVGERLVREVGIPIYYYAQASEPAGRGLAELRNGGFEALLDAWPDARKPDLLPPAWTHAGAHPTAGATCVGARPLLLAWNVYVDGVDRATAAEIARDLRESNGGLRGVRALALRLPRRAMLQISMNLEDVGSTSALAVFRSLEARLAERGGHIVETEVIGMLPDALVLEAAAERLHLQPGTTDRLLSNQLLRHLAGDAGSATRGS
ncbi:MAG: glutamate formimidoyltransferase [Longimicrobiales bacterium]